MAMSPTKLHLLFFVQISLIWTVFAVYNGPISDPTSCCCSCGCDGKIVYPNAPPEPPQVPPHPPPHKPPPPHHPPPKSLPPPPPPSPHHPSPTFLPPIFPFSTHPPPPGAPPPRGHLPMITLKGCSQHNIHVNRDKVQSSCSHSTS
ncbi:hypothetical protein JTE90_001229 [Oedothorax gibbosus]|uniref:Leucine-rich repeat extensin-like protein 3 n=1 Tax=Oedothorax gibbosus TaxID=931172 RepID=A0AAV6UUC4_9ARAC|nr:hypothetical protein JTE90_001229 [Oedothorax gibbosus]